MTDAPRKVGPRHLLVALGPGPWFLATAFVAGYLAQDSVAALPLVLLALLGWPVSIALAIGLNARGLSWRARAGLWAATLASALLACAPLGATSRAAEWAWERRTIAPRRAALLDLARAEAHRARAAAEGGEWVLDRRATEVEGYTFERVAFTPAGAWFLVRPASGIHDAWGYVVPFAGVDAARLSEGQPLRPAWVERLEPAATEGLLRFHARDGMSGGGAPWLLDERYQGAR
jgi:hypothetical protein